MVQLAARYTATTRMQRYDTSARSELKFVPERFDIGTDVSAFCEIVAILRTKPVSECTRHQREEERTNEAKESSSKSLPKIPTSVFIAFRKRIVGAIAVGDLSVDGSEKMLGCFVVATDVETCSEEKYERLRVRRNFRATHRRLPDCT